jgi:hypothetical protein
MTIMKRNVVRTGLVIFAVSLMITTARSADLTLACEGTSRILGTPTEYDAYYELEFFWTSGAYRQFYYPDTHTRAVKSEGSAHRDKNQIVWGNDHIIDRQTGGMVVQYTTNGQKHIETYICKPTSSSNKF